MIKNLAIVMLVLAPAARAQAPARGAASNMERFGRYDDAAALYEKRLESEPGDGAALKDLMWAYWNGRRFDDARRVAEKVMALSPGDVEAAEVLRDAEGASVRERAPRLWEKAGKAYREDRAEEALALWRQVIELQPLDALSRKDLMWALWRLDRIERSMDAARVVLALRPGDREALEILRMGPRILEERHIRRQLDKAEKLMADDRFEEAIAPLLDISHLRPRRAAYRRLLIQAADGAGRLEEAIAFAEDLADDFPDDTLAWTELGRLQLKAGKPDEAIASLERALGLDPGNGRAALLRADIHLKRHEYLAAERLLTPFERDEDRKIARAVPWPLGQALFWQGKLEPALGRFDQAAKDFPKKPDYRFQHAWTLLKLGRADQGRAELTALWKSGHRKSLLMLIDEAAARGDREALLALAQSELKELSKDDAELGVRMAGVLEELGRPDDALDLLERLLDAAPDSEDAWLAKGRLELDRGRIGAAVKAGENARRLSPGSKEPHYLLARAAAAARSPRRAERHARAALELAPDDAEAVFLAARLAYEAGKRKRAFRLVREWEERHPNEKPVVAYQGLANVPGDPMLGSRRNHLRSEFEAQVKALKDSGLDARIEFEGGRADALAGADPALARTGARATVYSGGEDYPPAGRATRAELEAAGASGRWDTVFISSGRAPVSTRRVIPGRGWTGEQLVAKLKTENPMLDALALELDWAVMEGSFGKARGLLKRMSELGAAPSTLLAKEAAIEYYSGRLDPGLELARQSYKLDENAEAKALVERGEAEKAPALAPDYRWFDDSQGRTSWSFSQVVDAGRYGWIRPRAEYRRTELMQTNERTVTGDGVGGGVQLYAPRSTLSIDAANHFFTGAPDDYSVEGALDSRWAHGFATRLEGARTPLFTARALNHGKSRKGGDFAARWRPKGPWKAGVKFGRDWYSDGNRRTTVQAEGGRELWALDRFVLSGIYRFVYDEAERFDPDYYSPRAFTLHGLGPELSYAVTKNFRAGARWLPTRSAEHGSAAEFTNQARAILQWAWGTANLIEAGYDLNNSPGYRSMGVSASATVRFP